jgi:hypothetical protein
MAGGMQRNPAVAIAVALFAVSTQAVIAAPNIHVTCRDGPARALERAGVGHIYSRVDDDPELWCLGGRLEIAIRAVIREIAELARQRGLPCSARCWLDRPSSAVARVGPADPIWPAPPNIDSSDLVFIVCVPDLDEGWWWIVVSEPDRDGRVEVEVIRP